MIMNVKKNKYRELVACLIIILASGMTNLLMAQTSEVKKDSVVVKSTPAIKNTFRVAGIVTDNISGKPINGASVSFEGNSVLTDENGKFNIPVSLKTGSLFVSAPGYMLRELGIRSRKTLDISLISDHYTTIYGKTPTLLGDKNSTEIINSVNSVDKFPNVTPSSTIEDLVQTRLGNIRTIIRSGTPLMGAVMFIRGLNSLNANAQPLFVVDGVIWDNLLGAHSAQDGLFNNPLADMDLKDLESVTVIKDGTTIYGSKGANGVVLINTIRGRDISTKITINSSFGYSLKPSLVPVLDRDNYKIYASEMFSSSGGYTALQIAQMPMFNEDPGYLYYNKYHNNTHWADYILRNGISSSHAINVSGGDDNALYAFSLGYTGIQNVIKNSDVDRLNARFNSDIHLSKKADLHANVSFSNSGRTVFDDGINARTSPYYLSLIKSPLYSPFIYQLGSNVLSSDLDSYNNDYRIYEQDSYLYGVSNPLFLVSGKDPAEQHSSRFRLNMSVTPEYKLNSKITFSSTIAFTLDKLKETYYTPVGGTAPKYIANYGVSYNLLKDQTATLSNLFNDTRFKYESNLFGSHKVQVIAGLRFISRNYQMDYIDAHNSGTSKKVSTSQDFKTTFGIDDSNRYIAWYGSIDYSIKNKYFFNFSGAIDSNSDFGKRAGLSLFNHGWAYYPGVATSWVISNERFMRNVDFIDLLKLRAGYSLSGNDDIKPYSKQAYFVSSLYMGQGVGLELANLQNDHLRWETATKSNLGIDLSLWNDRLSLSADYFSSKTKNLLSLLTAPSITGQETYWGNSGELQNKGYELSLKLNLVDLTCFKWEANANVSHYKNKMTSLPQGNYLSSFYGGEILTSVGSPAGVFYGYKSLGVISSQSDAEALHQGAGLKILNKNGSYSYFGAGDMLFEDRNNDGIIDEKDKQVIGDPNPRYTGFFGNRFRIKNVTLDVLFSFSYGNDVYNKLRRDLESMNNFFNQTTAVEKRWRVDGDQTSIPKLSYADPMGNSRFSSRWIEDGSCLRLKTLSLSYSLPFRIPGIEGVTLWASVNNLWKTTKYLGVDPETSVSNSVLYQGVDVGLTPQYKSYSCGVKINL